MDESITTDIRRTIEEFAGRLNAIVGTAAELVRSGVPRDTVPDAQAINDLMWELGQVGAHLDQLMQRGVGLHAPVLATYGTADEDAEDDRVMHKETEQYPEAWTSMQALRLEFVIESLGSLVDADAVKLADEAGGRIAEELIRRGCRVREWGTSLDDVQDRG